MRVWLYSRLTGSSALAAYVNGRIIQGESAEQANILEPFIVYTIGNATDEELSEEPEGPQRQFFQIYIHDRGGDYSRIDNIVAIIKTLLRNQSDKASGIINVIYLETSRDLDDSTMGTILRYIRFVAIKEK